MTLVVRDGHVAFVASDNCHVASLVSGECHVAFIVELVNKGQV